MKLFAMIGAASSATFYFGAAAIAEAPTLGPADYLNDVRLGEKVDRICFRDQVDDFREGTESTIILERGAKDYLVETEEPCGELDGAQTLSLNNAFSSGRCITTHDQFYASQNRFSSVGDTSDLCRIKAIYRWNEDARVQDGESIG
ncbi:DUF6491 family protein [Henriciella sp.]|jgi:hypothetical protein|uniref:DUF6491 family protein n=1 Tax=Henriciella sp. TaxID=1968823 RepID=UPI0025C03176|nr:DUF6491 family protein [Henriciella sp.]|tara:strand:+ start:853 stop:1290 length:438 start_codon:yes stop_codon:yes gene_type:complete